jgi:outer membrane immunogenic protein
MTWTGFYAGLNAGYGWANTSLTGVTGSSNLNGFVGGGQIGYNWQISSLVLGLEGDFQGTGQRNSASALGITVEQKLPWFATARGRIGYAFGPWMLYATGGAAWVNYKLSASGFGVTVSDDATKAAWTIGGGVEWMFTQNWSVKAEYLYLDTGTTTVTLFGVPISGRAKDSVARLGVNYHF